jgi:RNA polymerase sigma-70 factor (ECF subfamily)
METTHEDPGAERLLQHATWIRGLARSLIADAATADDLVQETWVAALMHPPSTERSLRPWLATVLRNLVRKSCRRRAAQDLPAELPATLPEPEELCEQLESEQLLTRELSRLEEPYRSTLLLRFYRGLEPIEIARRQGIPDGTVRWRIKRGLALLRGRLEDRAAGSPRAWSLALLPLARMQSFAAKAAAGPTLTLPGILAMNATLKIGGAAAVALAAATALTVLDVLPAPADWFASGEAPIAVSYRPIPRADADRVTAPAFALDIEPEPVEPIPTDPLPVAVSPEAPGLPPPGVVVATLVDPRGRGLANASLREVDWDGPKSVAAADAQGGIRLALDVGAEGRTVHVEARRSGFASHAEHFQLQPDQTVDLGRIVLVPGGAIAGRVVDPSGRPVAGAIVTTGEVDLRVDMESARVLRTWHGTGREISIPRELTAEDGTFQLIGLEDGHVRVWAEAPGRMPTCTPPVGVRAGEETYGVEITLPVIGHGNRVAGVVLDPSDGPGHHLHRR